jgi:hypothetical protein
MMYKMSCTVGSGGLSIKPKKIDFFLKTIQSIFLLTKKTRKKSGKYLKLAEIAVAYKQFVFIFCTRGLFQMCVKAKIRPKYS